MITSEELEKLAELKDKGIITEDEFNVYLSDYCKKITLDKFEQIYILKEKNIVADNYFNKIKSDFIKDGKTGVFTLNKLEKLWDFKNKGIINKTEYDILKDKLMNRVTALLSAEELERLEALKNKGAITPEESNDRKLGKNISRNPYKQKNPSVVSSLQIEELEKLAQLKNKGIITEEEFNTKKQEFMHQNKETTQINKTHSKIAGWMIIASFAYLFVTFYPSSNKPNKSYTSSNYQSSYNNSKNSISLDNLTHLHKVYYCGGVGVAAAEHISGTSAAEKNNKSFIEKCKYLYGNTFDYAEYSQYSKLAISEFNNVCGFNLDNPHCSTLIEKCFSITSQLNNDVANF